MAHDPQNDKAAAEPQAAGAAEGESPAADLHGQPEQGHPMESSPLAGSQSEFPSGRRKPSPFVFLSAATEFSAVTAAFAVLGWWLDSQWDTKPWLMIVGLAMGMIGGTYKLWRLGRTFFR